MFYDMNNIIRKEIEDIKRIISGIRLLQSKECDKIEREVTDKSVDEAESIYVRSTCEGIVYYKQISTNGKHRSKKLGKADNAEVIRIKQRVFYKTMLKTLKKDLKLLEKIDGKFLPYDPDSVDVTLGDVYRDETGLVNKTLGVIDLDEWNGIVKKNGYPMEEECNITPDGMEARSKSEIIVYCILKGYDLVVKYDYEITLKDDIGQSVTVSPDFVILCSDGSLIIIEHLGLVNRGSYIENAIRRIHLYLINGYKLNENLFLTADSAYGKINAQAIDELVRKMILPRVNGSVSD